MSERGFKAACLQLSPGNDLARNLAAIAGLVARAAADGAALVALPEFATYLDRSSSSMRASSSTEADSEALSTLRAMAPQHGVWMLIGSLVIRPDGDCEGRLVNRSLLVTPQGTVAARYDKIHLFDARLPDGRTVGESRQYRGGDRAVVVQTPLGRIGMSVCYDVRFPQLYRKLAMAGAEILTIPAAFTAQTGKAHWETLLRARAIENGCYVLAPATVGTHPGDWHTHGHAMIIDPWGRILGSCQSEENAICASYIRLSECGKARAQITSLSTNPDYHLDLIS